MCSSGDEEQLLILRTGRTAIALFCHIERVGDASGNHQKRLIDEVHIRAGIERHQVHEAALGIAERRIRMGVALKVIGITFSVEIERQFSRHLRSHTAHIANVFRFSAFSFFLTSRTRIGKTFLNIINLRIEETVAAYQASIEHTERGNSLETLVGLRRSQSVATAAADAQDSDSVCIHTRILRENVCCSANIFNPVCGFVRIARLTITCALICSVVSETDMPCLRKPLTVQSGDLFFHSPIRMRDHNGRISF